MDFHENAKNEGGVPALFQILKVLILQNII